MSSRNSGNPEGQTVAEVLGCAAPNVVGQLKVRPMAVNSRNTHRSLVPSSQPTRGFTLVELLVVVGIIAVLIALLLPAIQGVYAQSQIVQCASNMRQIGQCLLMYADDNDGYFPDPPNENCNVEVGGWGSVNWQDKLVKYCAGSGVEAPLSMLAMKPPGWRATPWVDPNASLYPSVESRGIFHCPIYPDYNQHVFKADIPNEYCLNARLTKFISYTDTTLEPYNVYKPNQAGAQLPGYYAPYRLTKLLHPVVVVGEGATAEVSSVIGYYFEYMRHHSSIYPGQSESSGQFFALYCGSGQLLPTLPGGANYLWNDMSVSFEPASTYWVRCQGTGPTAAIRIGSQPQWCPWLGGATGCAP